MINKAAWALTSLRALVWLCASCLALAWLAITVAPQSVERSTRPHIIRMVGDEAMRRYPALQSLSQYDGLASTMRAKIARTQDLANSNYPEALALMLASLCEHQCSESAVASAVRASLTRTSTALGVALERTEQWARGYYGELVGKVLADLQVFLGTNCVLLLLAAACLQGNVGRTRIVLGSILVATTLLGAYCYLFLQNWVLALLFSSYVGSAYITWVSLIAATLLDCLFNKGRITQAAMSALPALFHG